MGKNNFLKHTAIKIECYFYTQINHLSQRQVILLCSKEGNKMELIVFTNNGQTYHFFEVEDFKPTTTGFSFTYTGKATGVTRKAVFNNTSTAGYALV